IVRSGGGSARIAARDGAVRLASARPRSPGPARLSALYLSCFVSNGMPSASASAITWSLSPTRGPSRAQMRMAARGASFALATSRLIRKHSIRAPPLLPLVVPPATEHGDGVKEPPVIGAAPPVLVEDTLDLFGVEKAGVGRA